MQFSYENIVRGRGISSSPHVDVSSTPQLSSISGEPSVYEESKEQHSKPGIFDKECERNF